MAVTQHLLHGLTGGSFRRRAGRRARAAVEKAREKVAQVPSNDAQGRADALCALGFAFPPLRRLLRAFPPQKSRRACTRTGVGHLFDGHEARSSVGVGGAAGPLARLPQRRGRAASQRKFRKPSSACARKCRKRARHGEGKRNGFQRAGPCAKLLTQAVNAGRRRCARWRRSTRAPQEAGLPGARPTRRRAAQGVSPAAALRRRLGAVSRTLALPAFDAYDAAHPERAQPRADPRQNITWARISPRGSNGRPAPASQEHPPKKPGPSTGACCRWP